MCGLTVAQNLWEWPTNNCSNLNPIPEEGAPSDSVWMPRYQSLDIPETQDRTKHDCPHPKNVNEIISYIYCFVRELDRSSVISREASCSNRWEQLQRLTGKHEVELGEPHRTVRGRMVGPQGVGGHIKNVAHRVNQPGLTRPPRDFSNIKQPTGSEVGSPCIFWLWSSLLHS